MEVHIRYRGSKREEWFYNQFLLCKKNFSTQSIPPYPISLPFNKPRSPLFGILFILLCGEDRKKIDEEELMEDKAPSQLINSNMQVHFAEEHIKLCATATVDLMGEKWMSRSHPERKANDPQEINELVFTAPLR
ncbi:hypothetical protein ACTXT7_008170 [Hymenolepis weldensis]